MAELETRVSFPLDQKTHKASLAALKSVDKAQKAPAQTAKKSEASYKAAAGGMDKLASSTRNLAKSSKEVDPALAREEKGIRKVDAAAKDATKSIGKMDKAQGGLLSSANKNELQEFRQAGRLQSFALQNIGQFAPGAAGGAAVSQFSGAFNLLDTIPKLDLTFLALKESVVENISAIGARGAGYIGALSVAGLAIGAVALGMHLLKKRAEELSVAEGRRLELLESQIVVENKLERLAAQGDAPGIISAREAASTGLEDTTDLLSDFSDRIDSGNARIAALQSERLDLLAAGDVPSLIGAAQISFELKIVRDAVSQAQEKFDEYGQTQEEQIQTVQAADAALTNFSQTQINAALNIEALTDIQTQLATIESERTQILAQQTQTQQRLVGIEAQRADLIASSALKSARAEEDAALTSEFAREDDLAQQQKHFSALEAIAEEGRQRLEIIQSELSSLPAERNAELQRIENEGNAKLGDLNADFMAAQIEKTHDFHRQTARAESDNRRARLRLIEDITSELEDAARENNVVAFLKAQRSGATRLRRQAQDDQTEEQRRVEDFANQQEKAAVAQQQRIQAAIEGIELEKQKTIEAFNERRTQLAATLEAEKATIEAATQATIDRYDEQEAREAQLADRQSQRDAIRDGRAETAHNETLARLDIREAAERRVLDGLLLQIQTLNSHQAILNQRESQLVSTRSSGNQRLTSNRRSIQTFAHGGIVTHKQLAIVGEAGPEAIIPLSKLGGNTAGLPSGSRNRIGGLGGTNITFAPQLNATVGDIASKAAVTAAFREYAEVSMRELHRLFEQSGMVA